MILFIQQTPKRWSKQLRFAFCAHAVEAPMDYDVKKELAHHGVSVDKFDEWFREWEANGRPRSNAI